MKHLILGAGNLGIDLFIALEKKHGKGNVRLLSAHAKEEHNEFHYPPNHAFKEAWTVQTIAQVLKPEMVWCCIGAGSVESAKEDFNHHVDLHLKLPVDLMTILPETTKIVLFSTDYLNEPDMGPRSLYALSKKMMEEYVLLSKRKNTAIFRVGSLYGVHKPYQTFPGKLFRHIKSAALDLVDLPDNDCCPTPTAWLAQVLPEAIEGFNSYEYGFPHRVSPKGTSINKWAEHFLEGVRVYSNRTDRERPISMGSFVSICDQPKWDALWAKYGNPLMERLKLDQIRPT